MNFERRGIDRKAQIKAHESGAAIVRCAQEESPRSCGLGQEARRVVVNLSPVADTSSLQRCKMSSDSNFQKWEWAFFSSVTEDGQKVGNWWVSEDARQKMD